MRGICGARFGGRKHGRLGVTWIASYPKSGNTWVRFLLYTYLVGPVESSAAVERAIPTLDSTPDLPHRDGELTLVKTHHLYSALPPGVETSGFIYIARHPKDVLLSNLNYQRLIQERAFNERVTDADYARLFIRHGGEPEWRFRGYGGLEEHIASWLDRPAVPHIILRYEDLKADTRAQLRNIVEFLGLPIDEARLDRAVDLSSFEQMRALEQRERFAGKSSLIFPAGRTREARSRRFMNEGGSRHSIAHIDPEADRECDQRFGHLMARLGYAS